MLYIPLLKLSVQRGNLMHRIALAILAFLMSPLFAVAQIPDPENITSPLVSRFLGQQDFADTVTAEVEYALAGIRFDKPVYFLFAGFLLNSEMEARITFNQLEEDYVASFEEFLLSDPSVSDVETTNESLPDIGDEHFAATTQFTTDGFESLLGVVVVRQEEMIVLGIASGLGGSMTDALQPHMSRTAERSEDTRIENSDDVLFVLPRLAEMPPGFTVVEGS